VVFAAQIYTSCEGKLSFFASKQQHVALLFLGCETKYEEDVTGGVESIT